MLNRYPNQNDVKSIIYLTFFMCGSQLFQNYDVINRFMDFALDGLRFKIVRCGDNITYTLCILQPCG